MTRITQLQQAMGDVDAVVLRLAENILLATGYWLQIGGLGMVVVPREGSPTLVIPDYEQQDASTHWGGAIETFPIIRFDAGPAGAAIERILRGVASDLGVQGGRRIGFEGSFETIGLPTFTGEANAVAAPTQALIRATFETETLVDVTGMLETVRLVKTDEEIARIRLTNEIAGLGLEAFKEHAVAGRTEAEVAAAVDAAIVSGGHGHKGARVVRSYATVWSGPETESAWQYFRHRARRIEPDDVVMVELGTVVDGFWADHTRTVVAGRATERQREALAAVTAGIDAAFAACRGGAVARDVDAASRAACQELGFTQFPHHTGHGLGFRYHEARPQLVPGSDHELLDGMIVAVEPGIYDAEVGGIRWEDDAVVTPTGAVRLVESGYALD